MTKEFLETSAWKPGTRRGQMAQDPMGGGLQPLSGLLASLCTKAGREWMIPEVLCTMLLLLWQRTTYNYNRIIFFDCKLHQEITGSKVLLQRVLWFLLRLSPSLETAPFLKFLTWLTFLEMPALGAASVGTRICREKQLAVFSSEALACGAVFIIVAVLNLCRGAQLVHSLFPPGTSGFFYYESYFSMFLKSFFSSYCSQVTQKFEVFLI